MQQTIFNEEIYNEIVKRSKGEEYESYKERWAYGRIYAI